MNRFLNLMTIAGCVCLLTAACDNNEKETPAKRQALSGEIVTIAGKPNTGGFSGDGGSAVEAELSWVIDVALDENGKLYIADGGANVICKVDNGIISTVVGKFTQFNEPRPDLAPDGTPALDAVLYGTFLVDLDADGDIYFSETPRFMLRKVEDGELVTLAGDEANTEFRNEGGAAIEAGIWNPQGLAVDRATGTIYYSDSQNNAVRKISDGIVTTVAGLGRGEAGYTGDGGAATEARLNTPKGLAVDDDGNLYISDSGNNVIRKISNGIITTIAGTGEPGNSGDGGPATEAKFYGSYGVAVDNDGNVYFADINNSVVRKVDGTTGIISTIAGNGTSGYSGDNGPATDAQLSGPWDVAVDDEGNVYIADTGNAVVRMILK